MKSARSPIPNPHWFWFKVTGTYSTLTEVRNWLDAYCDDSKYAMAPYCRVIDKQTVFLQLEKESVCWNMLICFGDCITIEPYTKLEF